MSEQTRALVTTAPAYYPGMPVQEFVYVDLSTVLTQSQRDSTQREYRRRINQYLAFCATHHVLPEEPKSLALWRDHLVIATRQSPRTIQGKLAAVRSLMAEAASREAISHETAQRFRAVRGVKVKAMRHRLRQHNKTYLAPEQVRALCTAPSEDTLVGIRDRALLAALASSGCRESEIAGLLIENLVMRDGGYFCRVLGKTDEDPREVHLSSEAYWMIQTWLFIRKSHKINSPYVFTCFDGRGDSRITNRPMTGKDVWKLVRKYARRVGLAHVKPHDLRRFMITQLARKRDIFAANLAAGHSKLETTQEYILDRSLEPGVTDDLY